MDGKNAAILISFLLLTVVSAFLLAPIAFPVGIALWAMVVCALLAVIVVWHSRVAVHTCPNCGNTFSVSALRDLVSPHGVGGGGWTYLRCPKCGKMVKAITREKK